MSDGSQLEINTIKNECIQVCLTEDGFTECCFVSSMHLAPDKETQLRKAIQQRAIKNLNTGALSLKFWNPLSSKILRSKVSSMATLVTCFTDSQVKRMTGKCAGRWIFKRLKPELPNT